MKTALVDVFRYPLTLSQAARLIKGELGEDARHMLLPDMLRRCRISGPLSDADGDRLYRKVAWPERRKK